MARRVSDKDKTIREYEKQLKRLRTKVSELEERGYRFNKNIVPKRPKTITQASVKALQRRNAQYLYEHSTALSEETGKVVKGIEYHKEEIKRNRKAKTGLSDFEIERKKKDKDDLKKLKEEETRQKFSQGEQIYQWLLDEISTASKQHHRSAMYLKAMLENEIQLHGKTNVMLAISQAPNEIVAEATLMLQYTPNEGYNHTAIRHLWELIRGYIPDAQEMREIQDAIEQDMQMERVD